MIVSVPDSKDSRRLFQLLGKAAGFSTAHVKQQVTGRLHVVVKLWAEGRGCSAGTPPLTLRQKGKLDRDEGIHPQADKAAELFILFRYYPENEEAQQATKNAGLPSTNIYTR